MSLEVLNTNLTQFANTQLGAKRANITDNSRRETAEKVFSPNKHEETKSVLVTEKLDDGKTLHSNDVRFQSNTPVAKLLNCVKAFNETELVKKTGDYKLNDHTEAEIDEPEETETNKESGSGFYIVTNQTIVNSRKLLPKSQTDLLREQISLAYNSVARKGNGTLVNLTF
ncbi:MAG: hypothetical protein Q8K92_09470 [Leadbetterella sp.]|nr:hypothetical protein [Leadbetterella sp.]